MLLQPLSFSEGLTLRTVPIPARNGELTITCVMGSIWLWGVMRWEGARPLSHTPFRLPIKVWLSVAQSACPVDETYPFEGVAER
jgi:hypothetical protein